MGLNPGPRCNEIRIETPGNLDPNVGVGHAKVGCLTRHSHIVAVASEWLGRTARLQAVYWLRMRPLILISIALTVAVGCSSEPAGSSHASPAASVASSLPPDAVIVPGGCGATPLYKGHEPAWLTTAGAHNNPNGLPYVLDVRQTAAGFIFGYPLRAGHPTDRANKVLWVVRFPRNGSPLEITGQLSDANEPAVHVSQPANSGPGEIYPSIVDVPQPGCWRFDLSWSGHRATVYLEYQ